MKWWKNRRREKKEIKAKKINRELGGAEEEEREREVGRGGRHQVEGGRGGGGTEDGEGYILLFIKPGRRVIRMGNYRPSGILSTVHYTLQSNKFFVPSVAEASINPGVMTELIRAVAFTVLFSPLTLKKKEKRRKKRKGMKRRSLHR